MDRVSPHYYYTSVLGLKVPLLCQFYIEWLFFPNIGPYFRPICPVSAQSPGVRPNLSGSGPIYPAPVQSPGVRPNLSGSGPIYPAPAHSPGVSRVIISDRVHRRSALKIPGVAGNNSAGLCAALCRLRSGCASGLKKTFSPAPSSGGHSGSAAKP